MRFGLTRNHIPNDRPEIFDHDFAPDWLTGECTIPGSTMDMRWFWGKHCMTLQIGQSIKTDFCTLTRIE